MSRCETILRAKAVLERIPFSRTTLWRRVAAGEFPQPIRLGPNSVGWIESEIEEWIEGRAADRAGLESPFGGESGAQA